MDGCSNAGLRIETPTRVRSNGRCPLCMLSRDGSKGENCGSSRKEFNVWVLGPGLKRFRQHVVMSGRGNWDGNMRWGAQKCSR